MLYNDKFAKPAQKIMDELTADGVLNPKAPFEHEVQWVFYELWHHEGRRARHGASMMGPDYTHWHGMYEVAKHFYTKFLPAVVETAAAKSPELRKKYEAESRRSSWPGKNTAGSKASVPKRSRRSRQSTRSGTTSSTRQAFQRHKPDLTRHRHSAYIAS